MLKTWSFWKAFFGVFVALVGGIQIFADPYISFEGESLKQLLGTSWWIVYYVLPLIIALSVAALTNAREEIQAESLDQRNRRVMLDHVENFWVKGVLEKSLHGAALLELGIKEDPGAVSYPWTIKRETTNETLPAGKSMFEIFEEVGMGRSLLILGAPGSGKTTMLLELTRQLIELARDDDLREPIPVVFNLASWTEKQSISDWLADQLNMVYYVPKKTATKWVSDNKLLLLLDGLDEVKAESRAKCVEAINQFRKEHGLTSVVVCSRSEEYSMLTAKLSLQGAITIQPLSPRQINAYFDRFGKSLVGVKGLLRKDEELRELAGTPLMLSIMILAYKGLKPEEFVRLKNEEEQRKYIFDTYIGRMFERPTRVANSSFTKRQTLHYLSWLARMMELHDLTAYQIETMQPTWLEDELKRRSYNFFGGLGMGLLGGLSFGLMGGLGFGLGAGLMVWLIIGLIGGPIVGSMVALSRRKIYMVDKPRLFWKGTIFALIIGLGSGLSLGLMTGLFYGMMDGLIVGFKTGLIFLLITVLGTGLSREQIEKTTHPGQRLKQSFFNGSFLIISSALCGVTISWLIFGVNDMMITWLTLGLIFGLIGASSYGMLALIQHFTLRFLLIRDGYLPRQLIPFLDYAVGLIFLRRVGGSYIFIHRLIMEHFAEMDV